MDRRILFIVLLLVLTTSVYALTPEEKAYIDQTNQKTVAQLSAKIDSSINKVQNDMETKFELEKENAVNEMSGEVKKHIKASIIGLIGMMIITLAVFRILDLRFSHSKNVVRYEKELKSKLEALKKLEKEMVIQKKQLDGYSKRFNIEMGKKVPKPKNNKLNIYGVISLVFILTIIVLFTVKYLFFR